MLSSVLGQKLDTGPVSSPLHPCPVIHEFTSNMTVLRDSDDDVPELSVTVTSFRDVPFLGLPPFFAFALPATVFA